MDGRGWGARAAIPHAWVPGDGERKGRRALERPAPACFLNAAESGSCRAGSALLGTIAHTAG